MNEDLLAKNKTTSAAYTQEHTVGGDTVDQGTAIKSQKKQNALLSLKKYASVFPEKVSAVVSTVKWFANQDFFTFLFIY